MKTFLTILLFAALAGCASIRDRQMAKLINEKMSEDIVSIAANLP